MKKVLLMHTRPNEAGKRQMTVIFEECFELTGVALFADPDTDRLTKDIPPEHRFGPGTPEELSLDRLAETLWAL